MRRSSLFHPFACTLAALVLAACSRAGGPIQMSFVTEDTLHRPVIRVTGLSSAELSGLRAWPADSADWAALLSVRVAGATADAPAVIGRSRVIGDGMVFTPMFPFDVGRSYDAVFDSSKLPVPRAESVVRVSLALPAVTQAPSTTVVRMLPTADVLPENLLRVYLEFSAPMSSENGRDFLKLLDDNGREVPNAFLALDIEFWSPDHRRYSLFFDPGRVKRGILPNDEFGRALRAGHRYTIEVDARWRDANGQPLAAPFRRTFQVAAADLAPIRLADWKVKTPPSGTREPVVVTFPKPLDHGLLQRAVGVSAHDGVALNGEVGIGPAEREWTFTPREPWRAGPYTLFALSTLEDPAGNRIGRPFDVDTFERIERSAEPERFSVPFSVR